MKKIIRPLIISIIIYFFFVALASSPFAVKRVSVGGSGGVPTGIYAVNNINPIVYATAPLIKEDYGYANYTVLNLDPDYIRGKLNSSFYIQVYWILLSLGFGLAIGFIIKIYKKAI